MSDTYADTQAEETATDSPEPRHRRHTPGFTLDCGANLDVDHVGIVFVHGIGSQQAGETLLNWGGKIISLLLDARVATRAAGDPVIACELDPGPSESRYIELQLPKATRDDGTTIAEQHWVMTEAWWAQRVHPPSFGEMAEWLGPRGAIKRILLAMLPRAQGEHDPRLRPFATVFPLRRDETGTRVEEAAEHGNVYGPHRNPRRFISLQRLVARLQAGVSNVGSLLTKIGAGLYLQAISALILVIYGALRSVEKVLPFGPLRDGALTRPIDNFMLDWFGDVYVLLRDPAQTASVRGQLTDALQDLDANHCQSVVVVAHSGGAIVSYMTLADEAKKRIPVSRLITLGEGLNLAWRLTAGDDGQVDEDTRRRYQRLYTDVFDHRPNLKWDDFWSSQDPAPVGVLNPSPDALDTAHLGRIQSHAVWNRLAFGDDHGAYWDNDEEFLMPLVRLLDVSGSASQLFDIEHDDASRSNRRRRRLSMLSIWRQLALVAPTGAIVIAFALGSDFARRLSDAVATLWKSLPGSDVATGPLDQLRGLGLGDAGAGQVLAETGVWVTAALVGLVTLFALLAPPERPVPWWHGRGRAFGLFLRVVPWLVATPIIVAVAAGALQFVQGATTTGAEVGGAVARVVIAAVVLGALGLVMFGPPSKSGGRGRWSTVRDAFEMAVTIAIMVIVTFLALSPFVAAIAYPDVGATVLGCLSVVVGFQIIGRIGTWRWNVWDGRERVAARIDGKYPPLPRILVQMGLLTGTVLVAFAAVVTNQDMLALVATIGAGLAVLLGIAVDVFDTARGQRRAPADAMLQGARRL